MPSLEVIALTLEDAVNAQAGGANSLELIHDLALGGLTPDLEWVKTVRDRVTLDCYVMVRPHADHFAYDERDTEAIFRTIDSIKTIGVTGIVFGALNPDKTLNLALMQAVAHAKGNLSLTMHRALDDTPNPSEALSLLVGVADRMLSSGGARNIWDGRETFRTWVEQYADTFSFVCAGGVTLENVAPLAQITHAQEYHTGSAVRTNDVVDTAKVAQMRRLLDGDNR